MEPTFKDQVEWLLSHGYFVTARDPKRNTDFEGDFMVCQDLNEAGGKDASNGEYCIVGDDLGDLVNEAYYFLRTED